MRLRLRLRLQLLGVCAFRCAALHPLSPPPRRYARPHLPLDVRLAHLPLDVLIYPSTSGSQVFVGGEFFDLPQEEQNNLLTTSNLVFCRAEPQDKQRLLKQLQSLGEVAAMTNPNPKVK